jgi:hypothetical protein
MLGSSFVLKSPKSGSGPPKRLPRFVSQYIQKGNAALDPFLQWPFVWDIKRVFGRKSLLQSAF